ncbi:short-chain dehydrogenase [Biscogniauxia marginata]|nr:short-chain dehydrogenase [Biscogniauxia marginata]
MASATSKTLVLITGANQGIGFETARHLVNNGKFHVLLGARSMAKAKEATRKLESVDVTPVVLDVADDTSVATAVKFVTERFGRLDILINNAGITKSSNPNTSTRENYRAVFDVNIFGVAVVTDAFLPLLRASKYPDRRIVNVTTGLAQFGVAHSSESPFGVKKTPGLHVYRASKAALHMLTAESAVTLASEGITVTLASPGYCRTNFTHNQGFKDADAGAMVIVRAAIEGDSQKLLGTIVCDECSVEEFGW